MSDATISIIIPIYNKYELTSACLKSLHEHTQGFSYEVIVVDNGSHDASVSELPALGGALFGDSFRLIRLEENLNFGPACNLGAQAAQGEHLFFLNNDTLLTSGWLPPLLAALDGKCAMVGPLLLYPQCGKLFPDRVQHIGVACHPQLHPCHLYEFFPADHPVVNKQRMLQFITGAAMLIPKSIFLTAGMFCEEYINGAEDLDLCIHVKNNGYTLKCETASRIYHLQSQTPGRHAHEEHNAMVLKKRCLPALYPDLHMHLKNDGYTLALNEMLFPYAALPENRAAIFERHMTRKDLTLDVTALMELINKEPLFFPAYDHLIEAYQQQGAHEETLEVLFLLWKLSPTREVALKLHSMSDSQNNEELHTLATESIALFDSAKVDSLQTTAASMIDYCGKIQQPGLIDVYQSWLDKA